MQEYTDLIQEASKEAMDAVHAWVEEKEEAVMDDIAAKVS